MLCTVSEDFESPGAASTDPLAVVGELLRVVPRFVDRTRNQVELAASLASRIPCVSSVLGTGDQAEDELDPEELQQAVAPNDRERVPVDVLSVLESGDEVEPADAPEAIEVGETATGDAGSRPVEASGNGSRPDAAADGRAVPSEADLPIPDYDSLAAAHVVPRLATMSDDELLAVRGYEQAHRNRRTILNRIAQRLNS